MVPMLDSVVRGISDDGSFRVITACTSATVRGVLATQAATGDTARHFGDLITGAVLVREKMSPKHRVQGILKGANKSGNLVADSHPGGATRGLVQIPKGRTIETGSGAILQMMRTMPNGSLHQGFVEVPEPGGISAALMEYMQSSEQVESVVAVGTLFEDGKVVAAGGYIVQLLPEVSRDALARMTDRLASFDDIARVLRGDRAEPRALLAALLDGMAFTQLEETVVEFDCRCSEERVVASLATLGRGEIRDMRAEDKVFEVSCDYCGKVYEIGPAHLDKILDWN